MIFSSIEFIFLFLPLFLFLITIFSNFKRIIIILFSIIFMFIAERNFIFVVSGIAIFNFFIAPYLVNKKILFFGVLFNLSLLIYYKYLFFINDIFKFSDNLLAVTLPVGISFITFHSISYLADVYLKKIKPERNFLDFYLFIFMFPQVIAGPITRYSNIYKKIKTLSNRYLLLGFYYFFIGLFQKVFIADTLGQYVDEIYALPAHLLSSADSFFAPCIYILQLYFDFSGYTHMAIGLGLMIGVKLPRNFNFPLESYSINEFWKRWHISLTSFIRDYLFIPINKLFNIQPRSNNFKYFLCILFCFLLSGLWHGANNTFVLWGLFHAIFAIFEKIFSLGKKNIFNKVYFLFVLTISFIFFRSETIDQAYIFLSNFINFTEIDNYLFLKYLNLKFIIVLFLSIILSNRSIVKLLRDKMRMYKNSLLFYLFIIFFLSILLGELMIRTYNPFIYFRF
jgi:alginate O-acetyltransferase complex protein AlgI